MKRLTIAILIVLAFVATPSSASIVWKLVHTRFLIIGTGTTPPVTNGADIGGFGGETIGGFGGENIGGLP